MTASEFIDVSGTEVHVLEAFVLTNSTLCSAVENATGKGRATREMKSSCVRHARSMLRILGPTCLLLQGASARSAVEGAFKVRLTVGAPTDIDLDGEKCRVIPVPHPTSHEPTNWSNPSRKYFRTTLEPLLRTILK